LLKIKQIEQNFNGIFANKYNTNMMMTEKIMNGLISVFHPFAYMC